MFQPFFASHTGGRCRPDHHPRFARFGGSDPRQRFERSFAGPGAGRERMFDNGEFQLVILHLLAERPSYGYELIKTLEEKLGGGYAPSPGVVYPTLTMLEEEGLTVASTSEGSRKTYAVTDAGRAHLAANQQRIAEILERLEQAGQHLDDERGPDLGRAMGELRRAIFRLGMRARGSRQGLSPDRRAKLIETLEAATRSIDEL